MSGNRELDARIAEKVFGYTLDYEFADTMGAPCVKELRDGYDEWGVLPAYSSDMSDAWLVVERLMGHGWHARVSLYCVSPVSWNCRFVPVARNEAYVFDDAPTAPLAICRAALAALGVDHENH